MQTLETRLANGEKLTTGQVLKYERRSGTDKTGKPWSSDAYHVLCGTEVAECGDFLRPDASGKLPEPGCKVGDRVLVVIGTWEKSKFGTRCNGKLEKLVAEAPKK